MVLTPDDPNGYGLYQYEAFEVTYLPSGYDHYQYSRYIYSLSTK